MTKQPAGKPDFLGGRRDGSEDPTHGAAGDEEDRTGELGGGGSGEGGGRTMVSNNKDKGLWKEEMDERINKEKKKIASAKGEELPPALDLDSFPCVEEAIRVADEFCDQYRALKREVGILQEENQRLRRMLEYYSIPSTRPSPPYSDNNESLQVLVQNCKIEKLKLKEILMKREKKPSPSSPKE
ncbi:hypothetical protein QYE76_040877 [Lolium multiflorum]|uniref:Uncharacterized protein n=1 Tax=Lolium multiflorum TaxID=4521 RepID=A0AAD8WTL1_LOLMU|nr:hypothetical protein QYE76_040877 [Lolium multiflorum]